MHTGNHNPLQLPEDKQYNKISTQILSGKLIKNQKRIPFFCFILLQLFCYSKI